jgi:TIR domain
LLLQLYRQEQVFISHAGPQKHFALHLRTQLQHAGIRTFVDERDLQPGEQHPASDVMKAACEQALLVVFLITRDFVRRPAAIQELRWAVAQRQEQLSKGVAADRALPQLLTVLYPTSVCPSWRDAAELQQLLVAAPQAPAQLPDYVATVVNAALADTPVDVGELQDGSLAALLRIYNADAEVQALADLAILAQPSVFRLDSVPRYDALLNCCTYL